MYLKSQYPKSSGIREIMRATHIKSTSTVSRQLKNLEKAGLVSDDDSNKYKLTEVSLSQKKIRVPITIPVSFTRRFLFTIFIIQIGCGILMILFSFVFIWFDLLLSAIIGLTGLVVGLVFVIFRWIQIRKQIQMYQFFSKKQP